MNNKPDTTNPKLSFMPLHSTVESLRDAANVDVNTLVQHLENLATNAKIKGRFPVRRVTYKVPFAPVSSTATEALPQKEGENDEDNYMYIRSYNCNEYLFKNNPPVLPTLARGLFIRKKPSKRQTAERIKHAASAATSDQKQQLKNDLNVLKKRLKGISKKTESEEEHQIVVRGYDKFFNGKLDGS
jgi:hypothetical protein